MKKTLMFGVLYLVSCGVVFADVNVVDLNSNGILDKDEAEVILDSNISLPAGEYFFNNLTITNNAMIIVEGDPNSVKIFKGVKINAVNLTINNGSTISGDGKGYNSSEGGLGTPPISLYQAGASYGGLGIGNVSTSTYGSAIYPIDLGSANMYRGGGAIQFIVSNTFTNNGLVSVNSGVTSSGGSIYVKAGYMRGSGSFIANGGGLYVGGYYAFEGGGGRIAIYYNTSDFSGTAQAKGGCGSLGMGYPYECAGDGTVGFFDQINNNLIVDSSWRFQKNDGLFNFNKIILKDGAKVTVEEGVNITANEISLNNSSLSFSKDATINVLNITLDTGSTIILSGKETIISDNLILSGNSTVTVLPENVLNLSLKNITVTSGSIISASEKGYSNGGGPGAPTTYSAGASYGGLGYGNSQGSIYGSETEPTDFGSAGHGYKPYGGGAIRLIVTDTLSNDGVITANGGSTSSGGSIYITTKKLFGSGVFSADGGSNYCPNNCYGSGGGGRIAIYYDDSTFTGETTALAGNYCWSGCTRLGGNGTVVMEQKDPPPPPCTVDCFSNVLFLPGLEASRLYKGTILNCHINCEDQLWEPNFNSDVVDLYLNPDGTSKNSLIYTRDIIKETNTPIYLGLVGQNIYKTFSKTMDDLTDSALPERMARWEAYAYDWRESVDDIVNNGTKYKNERKSLITTLENLVASSTTGKVTIIAHSNGGLLAKALLVKLQEMKDSGSSNIIDKIDNLILVAVPQIGTASAVPAMLHGYDQKKVGGLLMTTIQARELGRNMKSAYGLLPSQEYINRVSASPIVFEDNPLPSNVTTSFINAYGNVIDSYLEYKSFLLGSEGRSQPEIGDTISPINLPQVFFNESEALHNKLDTWLPPSTLRVIEVAGWGLDTVASFKYYPKRVCDNFDPTKIFVTCRYVLDEKPIFTIDGDKTVVEPSALYGVGEKVWVNIKKHNEQLQTFRRNREHKDILEISELDDFISSLIKKEIFAYNSVLLINKPTDTSNRLRISIHSPVTLGIYDSSGSFTGKICPADSDFCFAKEEIPNSSYFEFGEGKYINLPEENLKKVVLQGTDIGTFTYESEKIMPDGTSTTTKFVDIPVTSQMTAEVILNTNTQNQELKIDTNSDGLIDIIIQPSNTFNPISYLLVMKKTIESLDITKARKNNFTNRIDNTIKAIQKGKINKAKLKVERFTSILERRIDKKEPKKPKPHRLSKVDAEQLLLMLDTLLNNLN